MKKYFITDHNGKRLSVILPIKEYNRLLEEVIDARLYDKAKKTRGQSIPLEEYLLKRKTKPGT